MSDWLLFLSRLKISGDLPLLSLSLSDLRLQEILQLAQSIPLPEGGGEDQELEMDVFSVSLINPQGASCSLTSLTLMAPVAALCHWLLLMQKYWISIKNGHYYRDLFKIWYKRQSMWSQQIIQNSSLSNWYLFAPIENDSIIIYLYLNDSPSLQIQTNQKKSAISIKWTICVSAFHSLILYCLIYILIKMLTQMQLE